VSKGDYRTISWVEYADYQSYIDRYVTTYGSYPTTDITTENATSNDAFQYATLKHDAVFTHEQIDQVRTSINNVAKRNPNFGKAGYTFSFQFWGHTDVRCDPNNDWSKTVKNLYDLTSPCSQKTGDFTSSSGLFSGKAPDSAVAPFSKNFDKPTFQRYTPSNASLAERRAKNLRAQVIERYAARNRSSDWALIEDQQQVFGAGEWFSWNSTAYCNDVVSNCAPERIAELIIVQTHTYDVITSTVAHTREYQWGSTSSVVSRSVNCEYYGTCLDQPDFTLTQPAVNLYAWQQQGTHSLTFPAASVSCSACKAPVSSGAPTTGWTATVESATLTGVSLTPPPGYKSPKNYTFKAPSSDLTKAQKASLTLYGATHSKAPYKLEPGTVTATIRLEPWLWDGQRLTWLTDNTVRLTKTVTPVCTRSTTCKFGVIGSNTVG
jgi:hypothetical protein